MTGALMERGLGTVQGKGRGHAGGDQGATCHPQREAGSRPARGFPGSSLKSVKNKLLLL